MSDEAVWIVTTYDLGGNGGECIEGVFSSKALADAWIDTAWDAIKNESWAQREWWGERTKESTYTVEEQQLNPVNGPSYTSHHAEGPELFPPTRWSVEERRPIPWEASA